MRKQVFTVMIETKERDGCGNPIPALSEGDVRKALMKGLETYDSISVSDGFDACGGSQELVGGSESMKHY